jgi:hypothetical protein
MNSRTACAAKLLLPLLVLTLPVAVQAGDYTYTTNSGTITITGYTGPGGAVTIPSLLNGLPVTSIGDEAFRNCASLTSVTIDNSVTSIGYKAFVWCTNLTSVTIGNSVTSIGFIAFEMCFSLTSVTIGNSVTSIGNGAFFECSRLTAIYFLGNAPSSGSVAANNATIYYLAGTTGWTNPWGDRPTALALWDFGSQYLGGGWKRLSWFGDYADMGSSWIWHPQHGYEYVYSLSTPTSIYFWDHSGLGWLWTSSTLYPYLYRFSGGAWLWYQSGSSSPRWFFNLTAGQWESH